MLRNTNKNISRGMIIEHAGCMSILKNMRRNTEGHKIYIEKQ